jgi:hypothetical protein
VPQFGTLMTDRDDQVDEDQETIASDVHEVVDPYNEGPSDDDARCLGGMLSTMTDDPGKTTQELMTNLAGSDVDSTPMKCVRTRSAAKAMSPCKRGREEASKEVHTAEQTPRTYGSRQKQANRRENNGPTVDSKTRRNLSMGGGNVCGVGNDSEEDEWTVDKSKIWGEAWDKRKESRKLRKRAEHAKSNKLNKEKKMERHAGRRSLGVPDSDTEVEDDDESKGDESFDSDQSTEKIDDDGTTEWRVTVERKGWEYTKRSCHIDSWLMAEVAVDIMSPARWLKRDDNWSVEEKTLWWTTRSLTLGAESATSQRDLLRK